MDINAFIANRLYAEINGLAADLTVYYATLVEGLDPPPSMEWEYADRKDMLKRCTIIVRLLDFDLSCYPLTTSSVIFFDQNGDPIP